MSGSRTPQAEAGLAAAAPLRGSVLFVHGLWLTGAESFLLRRRLAREGWNLKVFAYSSVAESPDAIARRCARQAHALAERTALPVHLVGHSLGGLIIHRLFAKQLLAPDAFSGDFCRVVFLGTPSAGSRCGHALARWRYGRRMLGEAGRSELLLSEAREWRFPAQLGVIAGNQPIGLGRLLAELPGPNDGTVAVCETEMPGMTAHCVMPVSHTGLVFAPSVAREIANFLARGAFSTATPGGDTR